MLLLPTTIERMPLKERIYLLSRIISISTMFPKHKKLEFHVDECTSVAVEIT